MIEIKNVYKSFDGHEVLKGISTTMEDGKCNFIIGQSGSGKTVLLKLMLRLYEVDRGEILFDGRDISKFRGKELRLLHREVGTLFQGSALFDSQTVMENVLFPLEMWSDMSRAEREERAKFCLQRVNIAESAWNLPPSEISGGMQKRVAIARAVALNPRYLFCDEPNSGLDPKTSLVIDKLIQDVTREYNICTVINSHDMNSIMEIGDHIIFMKEGVKEWEGIGGFATESAKDGSSIWHSGCESLDDFVFASKLFKTVKNCN